MAKSFLFSNKYSLNERLSLRHESTMQMPFNLPQSCCNKRGPIGSISWKTYNLAKSLHRVMQCTFHSMISSELVQKQSVFFSLIIRHLITITCISYGNVFAIYINIAILLHSKPEQSMLHCLLGSATDYIGLKWSNSYKSWYRYSNFLEIMSQLIYLIIIKWRMIKLLKTVYFCAISLLEICQWNVHCFTLCGNL